MSELREITMELSRAILDKNMDKKGILCLPGLMVDTETEISVMLTAHIFAVCQECNRDPKEGVMMALNHLRELMLDIIDEEKKNEHRSN